MDGRKVLVTGITGFLGSHVAIQLLNRGYFVTGTLRDVRRTGEIRSVIAAHTANIERLNLVEADLEDTDRWLEITRDQDYVQHIASPFPRELPKDDTEIIRTARNGVLNVLRAAATNKVKRVVLTSSTGAIVYGKRPGRRTGLFTESDWTDASNLQDTTPYFRSKTIAEKAAWEFIEREESGMELTCVCPGAMLGPILEKDFGTSANMVIKIMDGSSPAIPRIGFDVVDVRSVAKLQILAMESAKAASQRYIGSAGYISFKGMAQLLKPEFPQLRIPSLVMPDFLVRLFSNFEKALKPILLDLNTQRKLDHSKASRELGWQPIPVNEAVLACARSVIEQKLIRL